MDLGEVSGIPIGDSGVDLSGHSGGDVHFGGIRSGGDHYIGCLGP